MGDNAITISSPQDFDDYGSIGAVTEFHPEAGPHAPVCPPTYANKDAQGWEDKIALSDKMTIPSRGDGSWNEVRRGEDGTPVLAPAVLVDSLAAQSHSLSQALIDTGIGWGRIIVDSIPEDQAQEIVSHLIASYAEKQQPKTDAAKKKTTTSDNPFADIDDLDTLRAVAVKLISQTTTDSWSSSHRIADSTIRFAELPGTGKQVWEAKNDLKTQLIVSEPRRDADWLWTNAANAVLFGYWMSNSGTGMRPKWARAVTSEVFGYGTSLVTTGTVKGSDIGDISKRVVLGFENGKLCVQGYSGTGADKDQKPSVFGFGTVPGPLGVSAVSCEVILRRSGISLNHLRQIRSASGPDAAKAIVRAAAAAGMYAVAATAAEGVFLRSGTDLAPAETVWTAHKRSGERVRLQVTVESARAVLDTALAALDGLGLSQAEPIRLQMGTEHAKAIALSTAKKQGDDD